jgi:Xaa-Pro aminopeptidase
MKLSRFQKRLNERGIDRAIFIHPDPSITYFTQCSGLSYAVLVVYPHGKPLLYHTSLDAKPATSAVETKELKKGWEKEVMQGTPQRIGINAPEISLSFFEKLKQACITAEFVDVNEDITTLRMQKTSEEITRMKRAGYLMMNIFNEVINNFHFRTESDVARFIDHELQNYGTAAFPTIVASGVHAAIPHHLPTHTRLKKGFLLLDFGLCYKNYCTDMTRTIYLGTPSTEEKERYQLLLNAQQATIDETNATDCCQTLAQFSRKQLGTYSSYAIHSLGHGIGIQPHEPPSLSVDSTHQLRHRTTFTIEPGLYFPDSYGIRIEDTMVKLKKAVILTPAPKELITLPL